MARALASHLSLIFLLESWRTLGSNAPPVEGTVRLVVFDMAGTTVRDDGLVLECFVSAAEAIGLTATRDELNARMGLSKLQVFDELTRRQLGPARTAEVAEMRDRGYELFRGILEASYRRLGVRPIRGAEHVFARLRSRQVKIALNTGFYRAVTDIIVDGLSWRSQVDAVVCGDDVREGRPAPFMIHRAMEMCGVSSVDAVMVVGDTPSDLLAGRNSGARAVVGVATGAHSAASLRRFPRTHLIEGVWDLPSILDRIERLSWLRP